MPVDALQNADNFRVQGSMTVIADPNGNAGNVNVGGTLVVTGTVSAASNLAVSGNITGNVITATGNLIASGSVQAISGLQVTSGFSYGGITGGMPANTSSANIQIFGTSAASMNSSLTMTGSGRIIYISQTNTSTTTFGMNPTASSLTAGLFQDGAEVSVFNITPTGTNFVLPASSMGSFTASAVTIGGTTGKKFTYSAQLQSWLLID